MGLMLPVVSLFTTQLSLALTMCLAYPRRDDQTKYTCRSFTVRIHPFSWTLSLSQNYCVIMIQVIKVCIAYKDLHLRATWRQLPYLPPNTSIAPQPHRPVLDLPAPEGWKAELTWVVCYIPRWFACLETVTHPGPV